MADLTQGVYTARRKLPRTIALSSALVRLGLASDSSYAKRLVSAGAVYVDGRRVDTSAIMVGAGVVLQVGQRSASVRFGGIS